jgi:hypothetical protein
MPTPASPHFSVAAMPCALKMTIFFRVILVTNSTSKVIPAIRSRCLAVRVAAPSLEDISKIIVVSWLDLVLKTDFVALSS